MKRQVGVEKSSYKIRWVSFAVDGYHAGDICKCSVQGGYVRVCMVVRMVHDEEVKGAIQRQNDDN